MELAENPSDLDGVRERILDAARGEFADHGFGAASVRTIAQLAGVTAAMINYYFGGKQGLYETVVAEAQSRLLDRLAEAISRGGRDGLPKRLALAYFDFLVEDRQLQRLLLRQVIDQGEQVRERAGVIVGPLRRLLEENFGDRQVADQYAVSVFGAISGYFLYEPMLGAFLDRGDPLSPESLAKRRCHVGELASLIERTSP